MNPQWVEDAMAHTPHQRLILGNSGFPLTHAINCTGSQWVPIDDVGYLARALAVLGPGLQGRVCPLSF